MVECAPTCQIELHGNILLLPCSLPSNCFLFPPVTPSSIVDVSHSECVYAYVCVVGRGVVMVKS